MIKHNIKNNLYLVLLFINLYFPCIAFAAKSKKGEPSPEQTLIIIFLIGAVVFSFIIYVIIFSIKESKIIKELCLKYNCKLIDKEKKLPIGEDLTFTNIGKEKKYENIIISKKQENAFLVCDYSYTDYRGNYPHYITNAYFVIVNKALNMPHFFLGEYELSDRDPYFALKSIKGKKVFIKEDKNFNERFFLKSEDTEATRKFFDNKIRDLFKNTKFNNYYYEGCGNTLIVVYPLCYRVEKKAKLLENSMNLFSKIVENNI